MQKSKSTSTHTLDAELPKLGRKLARQGPKLRTILEQTKTPEDFKRNQKAIAVGVADRCLEDLHEYQTARRAFGLPADPDVAMAEAELEKARHRIRSTA